MKTQKLYQILQIMTLIVIIPSVFGCQKAKQSVYQAQKYKVYDNAAIATAHPVASRIGKEIMAIGGNAVDAAISTQFALAVCYPVAGNIGGGGFMIYREASGIVHTLDFREKAPSSSTETMYQDSTGEIIKGLSTKGHLAVGVPGSVDGMIKAFDKFSSLKDWKKLVQPAIDIARNGFQLTEKQASNLNKKKGDFKEVNEHKNVFNSEKTYSSGDLFIQESLAKTLELIRDQGRDGFYKGENADRLITEMKKNGGIISHQDLEDYSSVWRAAISFNYKNYTIHSMPPPSSGGILLAQLFNAVEKKPLHQWGFQDAKTIHLMTEAEKRAFADRAKYIGDSDFYPVPVETLIEPSYMEDRMSNFDPNKATDPMDIAAGEWKESEETTHFSIVDKGGNAVSITTTLNGGFGSKVVVEGGGYILNNEMDDFSSKVGVPNMYGLVGAEANKIEPGKRMLSSMTPTIVEKAGSLYIVVGTPGGSTIITSVYQTIINIVEFNMDAGSAVAAKRFHHQWKPEELFYEENSFSKELQETLTKKGHIVKSREKIGRVEAIVVRNGKLEAGADPRGDDFVDGF